MGVLAIGVAVARVYTEWIVVVSGPAAQLKDEAPAGFLFTIERPDLPADSAPWFAAAWRAFQLLCIGCVILSVVPLLPRIGPAILRVIARVLVLLLLIACRALVRALGIVGVAVFDLLRALGDAAVGVLCTLGDGAVGVLCAFACVFLDSLLTSQ
jgi:hypothetical protein